LAAEGGDYDKEMVANTPQSLKFRDKHAPDVDVDVSMVGDGEEMDKEDQEED
jgi:hypothetical protein